MTFKTKYLTFLKKLVPILKQLDPQKQLTNNKKLLFQINFPCLNNFNFYKNQ